MNALQQVNMQLSATSCRLQPTTARASNGRSACAAITTTVFRVCEHSQPAATIHFRVTQRNHVALVTTWLAAGAGVIVSSQGVAVAQVATQQQKQANSAECCSQPQATPPPPQARQHHHKDHKDRPAASQLPYSQVDDIKHQLELEQQERAMDLVDSMWQSLE